MKAIVFEKIGPPLEVLQLRDIPVPEIRDDEVLIKMTSASINPGDFMFIQDMYPEPKKPHFPQQIAGNHGAGVITKVGKNVLLKPGMHVGLSYYNTWAEYAAVPEEWLVPLPADYPLEKSGQLMNAITAWDLIVDSRVKPGQWLVLTAGNSTVATIALQMAKLKGIKIISIVRRALAELNLVALGASDVIELSSSPQNIVERVMAITQNKGVNGVVDSVGGPLLGELIRTLAIGGQTIVYGGLSPEPFRIHNFDLLLKVAEIRSNAYRYFFTPPQPDDKEVLSEIVDVFGQTDFKIPLGGLHPLEDFRTAVFETLNHPERGKRLYKM